LGTVTKGEGGLSVGIGIAEAGREQETVHLALDERIGPRLVDRVLSGENEMRVGEYPRLAIYADLPFLHRFEEGGLASRRCPVQLVEQDDMSENRSRAKLPGLGRLVVHTDTGDVRWQEIGVTLDAGEVGADGGGDGLGEHCLADARDVVDQEVAGRED
jgi:hypothetical protein